MVVQHRGLAVDWIGYATVRIEAADGTVTYLDPGRHGALDSYDARDGDLVLVTHNHHYDPDGIDRVARDDATIVVYEGVDASTSKRPVEEPEALPYTVERIGETESGSFGPVSYRTIPAYNHPDGDHLDDNGDPMHPRGFGVGFVLEIDDVSILWPGDADVIDEHKDLDVSLFLPPIGGTFTMDRHQAGDLAKTLEPELTIPIHYDTFPEIETDAEAFVVDVANAELPVAIDHPN